MSAVRTLLAMAAAVDRETARRPRAFLVGSLVFAEVLVEFRARATATVVGWIEPSPDHVVVGGIEVWLSEMLAPAAVLLAFEHMLPSTEPGPPIPLFRKKA